MADTYSNAPGPEQRYNNSMSDGNLGYSDPDLQVPPGATLADLRGRLPWLDTWSDEDARRVPVFDGSMLTAGAIYADLENLEAGPFTLDHEQPMAKDDLFIAHHEVPQDLWDRLVQTPMA